MQSSATVDVDQVLETAKLRGPALVVLLCAASTLILDGFDIQAVGFVAPALVGDLQVERASARHLDRHSLLRWSAWRWVRPALAHSVIAGVDVARWC
jgi:hypothetical protein